jgi:phosphatidate cytidylyltransferase
MFRGRVNKPGKFGDLRLRLASSLAVAAVALLCIWLGGVWIALLAALAAAAMVLEWRSITAHKGGPAGADVAPYVLAAAGGVLLVAFGPVWLAVLVLIGLAAGGLGWDARRGEGRAGVWAVAGTLYIGAAAMAFVALRGFDPFGLLSIVWAALVVIAADVGGYFAGRTIGGPKLWPVVSPNKTWAGLIGGAVGAGAFGWLAAWYFELGPLFLWAGAAMGVIAQIGDLYESWVKRRAGVKDSGTLLPGHGGVLDRLDGLLAVVVATTLLLMFGFWTE